MYHYFNTVTNRKGDALPGTFVRLVDTTSGNTGSLYADLSLTPIISVSGLADAALVDADGNVDFYVASGTYHIDHYGPDGVTFVKRVQNVPMLDLVDPSAVREILIADRTYYVRSDGSDSNDGLSNTANSAFLTIQAAVNAAYSLDLRGHKVVINVADGTYASPVLISGPLMGAKDSLFQPLQIIGNEASPGNVIMSMTSNVALTLQHGAYLLVAGFQWQTTTGGNAWTVTNNSLLEHRNNIFANVAQDMIAPFYHSTIRAIGPTTVNGNANAFVHATTHSRAEFTDQTVTFNGNSFTTYLWGLNDATVALDGATLAGSQPLTGNTLIHDQSLLNTYSMVNAGGWGYASAGGTISIQDGSTITSTQLQSRAVYIRSDASGNHNDGLENTTARAFKSIQSCLDFYSALPFNAADYNASDGLHIHIADGTYAETIHLREIRAFPNVTITGNTTTPTNVVINGVDDGVAAIGVRTPYTIEGMQLNAAGGAGLRVEQNSSATFQFVDFGTCTNGHILYQTSGLIRCTGNYSISHGTTFHAQGLGGRLNLSSSGSPITVTLTGTPAFSQAFAYGRENSTLICDHSLVTFSGSATGKRHDMATNSVVDTKGATVDTYLPGNVNGTTATGGQYA